MARYRFPENPLVYQLGPTSLFNSAAGLVVTVFADPDASKLADITTLSGTPIANSRVTVDSNSILPAFLGPDAAEVLYVKPDGGVTQAINAQATGRFVPHPVASYPGPPSGHSFEQPTRLETTTNFTITPGTGVLAAFRPTRNITLGKLSSFITSVGPPTEYYLGVYKQETDGSFTRLYTSANIATIIQANTFFSLDLASPLALTQDATYGVLFTATGGTGPSVPGRGVNSQLAGRTPVLNGFYSSITGAPPATLPATGGSSALLYFAIG